MGNKISVFNFMTKMPVVAILGSTGTGKSKLAIELAKKFNGEIISADSMQVYKGLDIVTNKVTVEEQQQVVHHFISCIDSLNRYTVVDFRNHALPLIDELCRMKKLPIIVGGTNYYIESLLWDVLIKPENVASDKLLFEMEKSCKNVKNHNFTENYPEDSTDIVNEYDLLKSKITQDSLDGVSDTVLHDLLTKVDPDTAVTLHPHDRRKVIRSLQVYQQYGRRHSDILAEQRSQNGGSSLGGPLRYKHSIMLWLQCDKEVLEKRLDERVDDMIRNGLIEELLNFHRIYNESRVKESKEVNYEEGIFQSIGFKEFHNYLILPEEQRNSEAGIKLCKKAIDDVKLATRQYAKKQTKWVTNRFLRKPDRQLPPVYGLDVTDLSCWKEKVFDVACQIVESNIQGKPSPVSPLPVKQCEEDVQETHYCEICDKPIVGRKSWQIHITSRKHFRRKQSIKKKEAVINT